MPMMSFMLMTRVMSILSRGINTVNENVDNNDNAVYGGSDVMHGHDDHSLTIETKKNETQPSSAASLDLTTDKT